MKMFENLELKWKLVVGFAIPLSLIVIIAATVFLSLNKLLKTNGWVTHTYEAIDLGNSIQASLVNMETGLRGFLVSGKEEFLEPYHDGKKVFATLMTQTKNKVSDNPSQVARLTKVEDMEKQWLANHVEPAMEYRREVSEGADAARHFTEVSSRTVGKEKFDGFRAALSKVETNLIRLGDLNGQQLIKLLLIDMINQETGQRGFLLSGKEESLEPFIAGTQDFKTHSDELLSHLQRTSRTQTLNHLETAIEMANDWRTEAANPEIDARREMNKVTRTMGDITDFIEQGIGKKYMDGMRVVLGEFVGAESKLIVVRNEEQSQTAGMTKFITLGGAFLALLIGGFLTAYLTRTVLRQLGSDPTKLQDIAEQIADGNFNFNLDYHSSTGVQKSMAKMRENLVARRESDLAIQKEIDLLVNHAARGDFTKTIDLKNKDGVFLELSKGLNNLLQTCDLGLKDVIRVLGAIANGDLSQTIDNEYQGSFNELKKYSNNTIFQLKKVMGDINELINKANQGDFKSQIDLTGKNGFFNELSSSLNSLANTTDQGLTDVLRILGALAKGDLSQSINANYHGSFHELKEYSNNTVRQIKEVITEIAALVDKANRGDFSSQIDLTEKTGFFKDLSSSLNELMSTTNSGLDDMLRILGALAEGDLTKRISREYYGSFAQLKNDANSTAEKLTEVIEKIKTSSSSIGVSTEEISRGNSDLSQRTEEQASALEETASSMEEMTSTIKQSETNAERANDMSLNSQQTAQEGGVVVDDAVKAMDEINVASKKIADIISVIDEIAFQTNLLALNAAVEAARAGEQGRGFAVVAGEVRNLAQRSASAAKQIKDLIQDSVQKVQDGSTLVNKSGETLKEIMRAVQEVSSIIQEISSAAKEQTSGIQQINSAISQMDTMTQQNAALAEQASSAGESMASDANQMVKMINFFSTRQN